MRSLKPVSIRQTRATAVPTELQIESAENGSYRRKTPVRDQ